MEVSKRLQHEGQHQPHRETDQETGEHLSGGLRGIHGTRWDGGRADEAHLLHLLSLLDLHFLKLGPQRGEEILVLGEFALELGVLSGQFRQGALFLSDPLDLPLHVGRALLQDLVLDPELAKEAFPRGPDAGIQALPDAGDARIQIADLGVLRREGDQEVFPLQTQIHQCAAQLGDARIARVGEHARRHGPCRRDALQGLDLAGDLVPLSPDLLGLAFQHAEARDGGGGLFREGYEAARLLQRPNAILGLPDAGAHLADLLLDEAPGFQDLPTAERRVLRLVGLRQGVGDPGGLRRVPRGDRDVDQGGVLFRGRGDLVAQVAQELHAQGILLDGLRVERRRDQAQSLGRSLEDGEAPNHGGLGGRRVALGERNRLHQQTDERRGPLELDHRGCLVEGIGALHLGEQQGQQPEGGGDQSHAPHPLSQDPPVVSKIQIVLWHAVASPL